MYESSQVDKHDVIIYQYAVIQNGYKSFRWFVFKLSW